MSRTFSANRTSTSVGAPNVVPWLIASAIASRISGCEWPRISGPHEPIRSMYLLPSTSVSVAPSPCAMNTGSQPTLRHARTGELTPPGITRFARSKMAWLRFSFMSELLEAFADDHGVVILRGFHAGLDRGVGLCHLLVDHALEAVDRQRACEEAAVDEERRRRADPELRHLRALGGDLGGAGAVDVGCVALHVELGLLRDRVDVGALEVALVERIGPQQLRHLVELALVRGGAGGLGGDGRDLRVHDERLVRDAQIGAVLLAQILDGAPRLAAVRACEVARHDQRALRARRADRRGGADGHAVGQRRIGLGPRAARLLRRLQAGALGAQRLDLCGAGGQLDDDVALARFVARALLGIEALLDRREPLLELGVVLLVRARGKHRERDRQPRSSPPSSSGASSASSSPPASPTSSSKPSMSTGSTPPCLTFSKCVRSALFTAPPWVAKNTLVPSTMSSIGSIASTCSPSW